MVLFGHERGCQLPARQLNRKPLTAVANPEDFPSRIRNAHKRSIRHREDVLASDVCGCFYCLAKFAPSAIVEWVDQAAGSSEGETALCPSCGIDSVIGSASGFPTTREFLEEMHRYWFLT